MINQEISEAMAIYLDFNSLPDYPNFDNKVKRAPKRNTEPKLSDSDKQKALKNALKYVPEKFHKKLIPEFLQELNDKGRIYAYRFRPHNIFGRSIDEYDGIPEAKAIQVMIDNNLDPNVALYPYELVTYGQSGQVFQNWLQYLLVKKYLQSMKQDQTLVVSSGHPVGLFKSHKQAPRVIITNGLLVGLWNNSKDFDRLAALGVSNYGQMTAGGWMYIGSQGIVHGTYITILNAGRKYLGLKEQDNLKGVCFVSSGLGGMSGAQPKAVKMAGGVGVIAEVDIDMIKKCQRFGWVDKVSSDLNEVANWMLEYKKTGRAISIAYHGNVVDLLEYINSNSIKVELISDQTSCHDVDKGGYIPQGLTPDEAHSMLQSGQTKLFEKYVAKSLKNHFLVLQSLTDSGAFFWDYGNAFMDSVFKYGISEISKNGQNTDDGFIWPSYVEDIMGPICFDRGFGPFRWVCLSGKKEDLRLTDQIAADCIDPKLSALHKDNYDWIKNAEANNLVIGTQARILYADEVDRIRIALAFNRAVKEGRIGPVMMGRDHHDVSGTDSPFRETSNIYDGSRVTADMSTQCFVGNAVRGMTVVVLSNGGGVGIGKASNGGNGIFLDGSKKAEEIVTLGLSWDVMGGVARRSWSGNIPAINTAISWNKNHNISHGHISLPFQVDQKLLDQYFK